MAVGWGGDEAVHQTIESTINDGIDFARASIGKGESEEFCLDCAERIPEKRREVVKGCKYCVVCQEEHDTNIKSYVNRRGSKDSQLR